jgi:hypothetical protein
MGIFVIILCVILYFIPTAVGWSKKNRGAIFVFNLFLGWTILGWIIALVWGCTKD